MKNYSETLVDELEQKAKVVRRLVVQMAASAGHGHPGGTLSAVEIMTTLYFHVMRIDPERTSWEDRDRFVLSKGHGAAVLYAALGLRGYFPETSLTTEFRRTGCKLQGHPCMRKVPGVEMSSGSLGQGLSAGLGMALAARLRGQDYHTYVLMGDGEIQEGQIWEAAMAASHFKVDNLTAILDRNYVQLDGHVSDIMEIEPVAAKWRDFGWEPIECVNGHNIADLLLAFDTAKRVKGRPSIIIAHTVKGKGVSFMENTAAWHGVSDPSRLPAAIEEVTRL